MNQARKKVLYLITKATWGGAQRYVYDLATHLPKEKFEVIVAFGQAGKLANDLATAGIETRQLPSLGRDIAFFSDVISFFQILSLLRRERPDVLHLNSSKAAALGALASRLCGIKKIIFTVHGWPFKEPRNSFSKFIIYVLSCLTALLSHETITVSERDRHIGEHMWFVKNKMEWIPLGIQTQEILSRDKASSILSIVTKRPRIVTIAELTANKGIKFGIEAIALLRQTNIDVEYFIIGEGEERKALEQLAIGRGISDRVHFLGFVPDANRYLNAFDTFLLPSLKEGMPYVLLEAATADIPIVATPAVDVDFVVKRVPIGAAHAIADTLKETPEKTFSRYTFSLDKMVEETAKVY